jgi:GNAT superfamily N-acetyltransferase
LKYGFHMWYILLKLCQGMILTSTYEIKQFKDIPLSDPFFDSLKKDYQEFAEWYKRKSLEPVYVQYTDEALTGFMYLKLEMGEIKDIIPPLPNKRRIKIGTLKVEAHGTKLGERLIKKAFDYAIVERVDEIYLTTFPHHHRLIRMLEEFGFVLTDKVKKTNNGTEVVLVKSFSHDSLTKNLRKDYPIIDTRNVNFYLLSIKPIWHSQLFPDSILKTESYDLLSDISHTNSISKSYVCSMEGVEHLHSKDLVVIYRTTDNQGPAEYRSVATSLCVVEEVRTKGSFQNIDEYLEYTKPYSVFNESELKGWWERSTLFIIKMLYSAAFTKRVIRKMLAENIGLDRDERWGFLPLSQEQFLKRADSGGIDVRLVVR